MKHKLPEDGTFGLKPQLEGGCGYLLVAVVNLVEQLPVAVGILSERLLRTLPQANEGVYLFLRLAACHEPSQEGSLKVSEAPDCPGGKLVEPE